MAPVQEGGNVAVMQQPATGNPPDGDP